MDTDLLIFSFQICLFIDKNELNGNNILEILINVLIRRRKPQQQQQKLNELKYLSKISYSHAYCIRLC